MPKRFLQWPLRAAFVFFAFAAAGRSQGITPITLDENRHAVVAVTLHTTGVPARSRTFRFILDTCVAQTLIDTSIPKDFFWAEDGAGITLARVEVGGLVRDGVAAMRMELKRGPVGRFEDRPVDGVLGLSFFKDTRFTLDPAEGTLQWWPPPSRSGTSFPVRWSEEGWPLIAVTTGGGQRCYCEVDTGSSHGLMLPYDLALKPPRAASVVFDYQGKSRPTCLGLIEAVRFGSVAMGDMEAEFEASDERGSIGQGIWSWSRVCFDFRNNRITVERDGPRPRASSTTLPVVWDRDGAGPRLVITYVVPGGCFEMAGVEPGDEVVQAEGLSGEQLSRGAILKKAAGPGPHPWTVLRQGRKVELNLAP